MKGKKCQNLIRAHLLQQGLVSVVRWQSQSRGPSIIRFGGQLDTAFVRGSTSSTGLSGEPLHGRHERQAPMIAIHTSTIHATCPYVEGQWDYYAVTISTNDEIDVAVIEDQLNTVRGSRLSQEEIASVLKELFSIETTIEIVGRHSNNTETKVLA